MPKSGTNQVPSYFVRSLVSAILQRLRCLLALLLVTLLCPGLSAAQSIRPSATTNDPIEIDTPLAVSESGSAALERFIAADPTDPKRLLISASIVVPEHGIMPQAFFSDSGGVRWLSVELPEIRPAISLGLTSLYREESMASKRKPGSC